MNLDKSKLKNMIERVKFKFFSFLFYRYIPCTIYLLGQFLDVMDWNKIPWGAKNE